VRLPGRGKNVGTLDRASLTPDGETQAATAVLESVGLRAISYGFPLVARDDGETLDKSTFLYDALYASLQERQR
jgi:hypothetical protein